MLDTGALLRHPAGRASTVRLVFGVMRGIVGAVRAVSPPVTSVTVMTPTPRRGCRETAGIRPLVRRRLVWRVYIGRIRLIHAQIGTATAIRWTDLSQCETTDKLAQLSLSVVGKIIYGATCEEEKKCARLSTIVFAQITHVSAVRMSSSLIVMGRLVLPRTRE